jgi:hypothetical protein
VIYLPKQAQDLLVGLQMCAGGSEYLCPGATTSASHYRTPR